MTSRDFPKVSEHAFSPRFFFQLTMAESSMLNRKCYIDRTTTRKILYWQDVPICKMLSHFLYFQFICLFLYSCLSNQHGLKFSTLPPRLFSSFFFLEKAVRLKVFQHIFHRISSSHQSLIYVYVYSPMTIVSISWEAM